MYVYVSSTCLVPEEGIGSVRNGLTDICTYYMGAWNRNRVLCERHQMIFLLSNHSGIEYLPNPRTNNIYDS